MKLGSLYLVRCVEKNTPLLMSPLLYIHRYKTYEWFVFKARIDILSPLLVANVAIMYCSMFDLNQRGHVEYI